MPMNYAYHPGNVAHSSAQEVQIYGLKILSSCASFGRQDGRKRRVRLSLDAITARLHRAGVDIHHAAREHVHHFDVKVIRHADEWLRLC